MSTRPQQRLGIRRLGRDRNPVEATLAPPVGETLQAARERKGVDLYRAERDTKIRLRYLSALEDGDYAELPAPVYTKGFLRNYAIYLGLEPDDILDRWRDEMEQQRTATRVAVIPPPMPIVEPGGRRLHLTPTMIVAGLVGLVVLLFVGYIGIQLLRFAAVTPLSLSNPPDVIWQTTDASITLAGTSSPGARIHIVGPGDQLYDPLANAAGAWQQDVTLADGANNFTITAIDRDTQRESTKLGLTINVPLSLHSPGASAIPSSGPQVNLTLSMVTPIEGQVITDGRVNVTGTTTGNRIRITSAYLGTPDSTPAPSDGPSPEPAPSAGPTSTPNIPPAQEVTVGLTGTFNETLEFTPGRWQLTVISYATDRVPVARQVTIIVEEAGPVTHHLIVNVATGPTFLKVTADGSRVSNGTLAAGSTREFTATNQWCIRTDNAGGLNLVLDGLTLSPLGDAGVEGSWIIKSGIAPVRAPRAC
jgi:cytoskeletal protein RodZ